MTFNDVFIQGNGYISNCFHEYNMTCTCEKCNQKRVIGGFHVTSSRPCWWTKTKDLSLASFVRPPEVVHFSIVIGVPRGCQGRSEFAYCSTNTVAFESQLIVVWNDGGKLLGKQF